MIPLLVLCIIADDPPVQCIFISKLVCGWILIVIFIAPGSIGVVFSHWSLSWQNVQVSHEGLLQNKTLQFNALTAPSFSLLCRSGGYSTNVGYLGCTAKLIWAGQNTRKCGVASNGVADGERYHPFTCSAQNRSSCWGRSIKDFSIVI